MSRWKGIMKAVPFEEKRLYKWSPPFIVQPKYDGIRCRAISIRDEFILLSSEENIIYSVPHINEELKNLPSLEFDGELYCHGMSFEEITSITSRTINLHPNHLNMEFHVFDIVDCSKTQLDRLNTLLSLKSLFKKCSHIHISPFYISTDLEWVMRTYDSYISEGYEGIIVRNIDAPYERKRSIWVMKFKPKKEDEYEILGYEEEVSIEGTPKNALGSLTLKSGDGRVFKVGTGFSRDTRKELWETKENLAGKTARIQYQHLTSGKKVPRFPVFVEVINDRSND